MACKALDVLIHRPRTDGAAARQRHPGLAQRATSGPSTRIEARMVLTIS